MTVKEKLSTPSGKVVLGLDGFVDEVWQIINCRNATGDYELFAKMADFAKSVSNVGTGGYSNEIIRKRRSYGGFVANTGRAIGRLGCDVTLVGMFGKDAIDPVFKVLEETSKVISAGEPGISEVFEFTDGKIMLPFIADVSQITWDYVVNTLSIETVRELFSGADVVGLGYWSLLNNFDAILANLTEEVLIPGGCGRLFFDLADIRKREKEALLHTLGRLKEINKKIPVTISLNEHEADLLFSYFDKGFVWNNVSLAEGDIEYVREAIGIDELVIHTPYFAVAASENEGVAVVPCDYCEKPLVTTGAGDNFNGGYITACAKKLNLKERLMVGNATTGFYIRNGYSPSLKEVF